MTSNTIDPVPHRGTPKGVAGDGTSLAPASYQVESMLIVNQFGVEYDLQPLVTQFTISEELYSPIIVFSAHVRDRVNFFETFVLSGQETIKLKLAKIDHETGRERKLEMIFSVKEYPNYVKSAGGSAVQEYTLIAISDYAYRSLVQQISRSVKDNPIEEIKKIFTRDLNVTKFDASTCVTAFNGIIRTQNPLSAVEWLRTKAFDEKGSPFFIFANFSKPGEIIMKSWSRFVDSIRYPNDKFTYQYKQYYETEPEGLNAYVEAMRRIHSMDSNIRLDKLSQAMAGGFTNTVEINDISNKLFTQTTSVLSDNQSADANRLNKQKLPVGFGDTVKFFFNGLTNPLRSLREMNSASISRIAQNSSAIDGGINASGVLSGSLGRAKNYMGNIESMSHEIIVYGDFNLNPGKKIMIEVPKSVNNIEPEDEVLDEVMSGEYIVAISIHRFIDGVYTTQAKIIKDRA